MSHISLIMEYEDMLLGKRKNFSASCMGRNTNEKDALYILKYAFEKILRWSPETIRDYVNEELIDKLLLSRPLSKVTFPVELDKKRDLFYLAQAMYPDNVRYSKSKITLRIYQRVLEKRQAKYPKNFFSGTDGVINACICLQYALNQYSNAKSVKELYDYFSNKPRALNFLRKARLYVPCYENFEYPIDFLHMSLPETQKNELYYRYYRFKTDFDAAKGRIGL